MTTRIINVDYPGRCACGAHYLRGAAVGFDPDAARGHKIVHCPRCRSAHLTGAKASGPDESAEGLQLEVMRVRSLRGEGDDTWAAMECRLDAAPEGYDPPTSPGMRFGAAGPLGFPVTAGMVIEVYGQWDLHDQFGWQIKIATALPVMDHSAAAMAAYLESMPDIGPVRAGRILSLAKNSVENVIALLDTPGAPALHAIDGIYPERAMKIHQMFKEDAEMRGAALFLAKLGLPGLSARQVLRLFGRRAEDIIFANPFEMAEAPGLALNTVDDIATQKFGVKHTDERRLSAYIIHRLKENEMNGHLWTSVDAITDTDLYSGVTQQDVLAGLAFLKKPHTIWYRGQQGGSEPRIVIEEDRVYRAPMHAAERKVLDRVLALQKRPARVFDKGNITDDVFGDLDPAPEQRLALRAAFSAPVTVLTGGPGCIDAQTKLRIETDAWRGEGGRKYTVEDAYHKFHHIKRRGVGKARNTSWYGPVRTFSLFPDGSVNYNIIENIVYQGEKKAYRVVSKAGRELIATMDHPFKVPDGTAGADEDGYKKLENLKVGNTVIVRRRRAHSQQAEWDQIAEITLVGDRPVYDLVMAEPARNFVAGGFVVHNCGKTTTLRAIVDMAQSLGFTVALCAPTGKAAIRMSEQTDRDAFTVHRLMGYRPGREWRHNQNPPQYDQKGEWLEGGPLPADFVICDESSFLSVDVAAALFNGVSDSAHVLLVGDVDQLPPVGAGRVFYDLIDSQKVPVTRLTRIFRQAEESAIPHVARAINEGRAPDLSMGHDVCMIGAGLHGSCEAQAEDIIRRVCELAGGELPLQGWKDRDIQIISAQRNEKGDGPGTFPLNRQMQKMVNPPDLRTAARIGGNFIAHKNDRIIQTKNDYTLDIMNGEIGTVVDSDPHGIDMTDTPEDEQPRGNANRPVLIAEFRGEWVKFSQTQARGLQLAYAITVHRGQGSEFPCVVMIAHPCHMRMMTRKLVYTAITRASKQVYIVGNANMLARAAQNTNGSFRRTTLVTWLNPELGESRKLKTLNLYSD